MSRSPAHLAAAAVALRAVATALTADFADLVPHTGPSTWEGPAAAAHRTRALALADDARAVAAELRDLARRLDERAAELVAVEEAAAARLRERTAAMADAVRAEERSDG